MAWCRHHSVAARLLRDAQDDLFSPVRRKRLPMERSNWIRCQRASKGPSRRNPWHFFNPAIWHTSIAPTPADRKVIDYGRAGHVRVLSVW